MRISILRLVKVTILMHVLSYSASAKMDSTVIEKRVEDLLSKMTLMEKIGQMVQVDRFAIEENLSDITSLGIGSVLSGGGGYPVPNTAQSWRNMVEQFQSFALKTRLGIPLIYGVDAVHGHNSVGDAVIFPHNINLGASHDKDLVYRVGRAVAEEVAATGISWDFAPAVSIPDDIRWGRTYEGFSQSHDIVSELSFAFVQGMESLRRPDGSRVVLSNIKHFLGEGGTWYGSAPDPSYILDQGNTELHETDLRKIHLPPYLNLLRHTDPTNIMVSYSSWNSQKLHSHRYLLTDVLKNELGFNGFLVSDWDAIFHLPGDLRQQVKSTVNAGLDMAMLSCRYREYITTLKSLVQDKEVSMERIDDAVRRILRAKVKAGLFEDPYLSIAQDFKVGSDLTRKVAAEAVIKSAVLLKHKPLTLPLAKDRGVVLVTGLASDDIGLQCGGWTIEWQGAPGPITRGQTLRQGLEQHLDIDYRQPHELHDLHDMMFDQAVVTIAEPPYTEGRGDRHSLVLSHDDRWLIEKTRQHTRHLTLVIYSGRPLELYGAYDLADAIIAAWLPGSEAGNLSHLLLNLAPFTAKLPLHWPHNLHDYRGQSQLRPEQILFPQGFGLSL